MAEALLKHHLKGARGHKVTSAGLHALKGQHPDQMAIELLKNKKNIDISDYIATQIDSPAIRKADLILVMEKSHKTHIENQEPSAKGKIFRVCEWQGLDVPDPYRKGELAFNKAFGLIEIGISDWVNKIS